MRNDDNAVTTPADIMLYVLYSNANTFIIVFTEHCDNDFKIELDRNNVTQYLYMLLIYYLLKLI